MKNVIKNTVSRFMMFMLLSFASIVSFAQEKGLDVDINVKKESNWYQQPWVWVVGAAVFILLLVAVLKGGGSKSEA